MAVLHPVVELIDVEVSEVDDTFGVDIFDDVVEEDWRVLDLDSVVFDDNRDVEDLSVDFAVLRAVLVALVDVVRWTVREVA